MKGYMRLVAVASLFILFFCLGCNKEIPLPDSITLRGGTPDSLATSAAGGEFSVKFNSSSTWGVSLSASWIENLSNSRGDAGDAEIILKVNTNTEHNDRKGYITLTCGKASVRIVVYQNEAGAIILTQRNYTLDAKEAKIVVEFKTNIEYEVIMPSVDWVRENSTKALTTYTKEFIISGSNQEENRKTSIIVKAKSSNLADTIKILQTGLAIERERAALVNIYNKLSGERWTSKQNWLTNRPVGDWEGVTADNEGRVIGLDLRTNWLIGEFPKEICTFAKLRELRMGGSGTMFGELPKEIGNLKSITLLDLSGNRLSGPIPSEICTLSNLKDLYLTSNSFSGEIPLSIGNLSNLEYLHLEDNTLSGSIPQSISSLTKIYSIILNKNQLTGSIPAAIFNLPKLENLGLENNQLSGSIPATIGNATKIVRLSFNNNNLTGVIPEEFTQIADKLDWNSYHYVNTGICGNRLSGSIPQSLVNHPKWAKIWRRVVPQQDGYGLNLNSVLLAGYSFTFRDVNHRNQILTDIYKQNKYTVLLQWDKENYLMYQLAKALEEYKDSGLQVIAFDNGSLMESTTKNIVSSSALKSFINFLSFDHSSFNPGDPSEEVFNAIKNSGCKSVQAEVLDKDGNIIFSYLKGMGGDSRFGRDTQSELIPFLAGLLGSISTPYYESTDFSEDGKVITIQQATVGRGIDLVVMGDGFTDKDMAVNGKYESWTKEAIEHFFSVEPTKSFRNRFNVYIVKAVSKHQELIAGAHTALGTKFGSEISENQRRISGDANKCWVYAEKIVRGGTHLDANKAIIINVINSTVWAGTANMFPGLTGTIAHCSHPVEKGDDFKHIVVHEAVGHGLGKLADEYYAPGSPWYMPEWKQQELKSLYQNWGWYSNIDFTNDPQKIRWSWFLSDERYKSSVGIFEGAFVDYTNDVFRPSENSMMNSYSTVFNAPSRLAIYKFIMERSGEEYKFENFIKHDEVSLSPPAPHQ